jgi:superfamily II DNA or RNA helicase
MVAIVGRSVFLPYGQVDIASVKRDLTVKSFAMGSKEPTIVTAYEEYDAYLAVPRHYGLQLISKLGIKYSDQRTEGVAVAFPREVRHIGDYAYQDAFVKDILRSCALHSDFIVEAATGKGKTVCALSVIQKRGRNAIVLVDQENLLLQWQSQAKAVLGLSDAQIGIVQGKRCEYQGKALVIAMIQSLVQREYDEAFYEHFGTMVVDEVHTAGAPTFSQTLMMFPAAVRFGVSATVDRRDALQRLLHWNLGNVTVALMDKHDTSYVYYLDSPTVYSWYANISPKTGRILSEVAEDTNRNELLVEAIQFLYESGRDVLVISDRIEQLEDLMAMCYYSGIEKEQMGLYCGFKNVWVWEKDPKPPRKPLGYEKGTQYTPVQFHPVRKRIPKKELERIKEEATVIFATFGMFAKGVDVPRLGGGVDCTPRSKAQQVHGRILRKLENKFVPIWVTIRDFNSYRLEHQFVQRLAEYVESSAEIYQWKIGKGVRSRDVRVLRKQVHHNIKELKALNVTTQLDGRNTLVIPPTPRE